MESWEDETVTEKGADGKFHMLPFPLDADYINALSDWAAKACERDGLENGGQGKNAARWGPEQYWQRERFPAVRKAFSAVRLEDRGDIRTLEQLGFDYEADLKARDRDL